MKHIEGGWESYRKNCIPADAPDIQLRESRQAFYAGAAILFHSIMIVLDPGTEPTEPRVLRVPPEWSLADLAELQERLEHSSGSAFLDGCGRDQFSRLYIKRACVDAQVLMHAIQLCNAPTKPASRDRTPATARCECRTCCNTFMGAPGDFTCATCLPGNGVAK